MQGPLAAIAIAILSAVALSASSSSSQALPAPEPSNTELSAGLLQWGAETEISITREEMLASLTEKARSSSKASTKKAMCETLANAAQTHELPVGFFVRLINQESGFNPEIVSSAGAQGVAQFMPSVAREWGLNNPFDPHAALVASARFLRSLYQQFGNWGLAAAAYNGGMGRVQKWLDKRGPLPNETRHYVQTITGVPAERWVGTKDRGNFSIPSRAPCQEFAHLADAAIAGNAALPPAERPQIVAGPPSKTMAGAVARRGGMQVAVIKIKGAPAKVAAVKGKIAEPKSIVAAAKPAKAKDDKAAASVKVAQKAATKPQAKTKDALKPGKGRVQVADARGARK